MNKVGHFFESEKGSVLSQDQSTRVLLKKKEKTERNKESNKERKKERKNNKQKNKEKSR